MRASTTFALSLAVLLAPALLDAQDLGARLDSAMRAAEAKGFSGVVRVERDGVTLLKKGYGLANRAARVPFSPATVVQIGSNTKDFTVVAIYQLQLAGKLSVHDTLGRHFRGVPADKRGITIEQLLDHRAGFPQGIGGDFEPLSRTRMIDSAMHHPLLFAPGARASYSNTGYSLLAAIIEQVTGKSYDVYVRDAILAPLGLERTGFLLPRFARTELAHGYAAGGHDQGTMLAKPHAADGPYWNLRGNGGMLSTVDDMQAFYNALFETEQLLPAAVRDIRFNPHEPIGLAGGDGVNTFLYERDPIAHTGIIVATTNAAMKSPVIRRELGRLLGLPPADQGDEPRAERAGGRPAPPPLAEVLTRFIDVINAGDTAAVRRFVAEHFASDAGAPPLGVRVERIGGMHDRLGTLTVEGIRVFDDGPAEVTLRSATQGRTVFRVTVDGGAPYRIHGLQVQVGGPNQ